MVFRIGDGANLLALAILTMLAAAPAQALQCVPYARAASGIDLRGDAWRWWNAAAGVYERGHAPRVGAVMVFRKSGKMRLGHVAVVSQIIGSRQILIDHANWGPRGAGHGSVSKMVAVRDISPHNDWSEVQVWSTVTQDFSGRSYPTYGFIYTRGQALAVTAPRSEDMPEFVEALLASAPPPASPAVEHVASTSAIDEFRAFAPVAASEAVDIVFAGAAPALPSDIAPPQAAAGEVWDGDQAAAQRAGSRRY